MVDLPARPPTWPPRSFAVCPLCGGEALIQPICHLCGGLGFIPRHQRNAWKRGAR